MKPSSAPNNPSRRAFLQMAGMALGALFVPSWAATTLLSSPPSVETTDRNMAATVGVLLPESGLYERLGRQWVSGFQIAMGAPDARAVNISLRAEPMGTGTPPAAAEAARRLADDGVDVLIAALGPGGVRGVQRALPDRTVPLIVTGTGANVCDQAADQEHVFDHSLVFWQASWAAGAWAAQHLGKRAFVAASWDETGYDAFRAFQHGFAEAGGHVQAVGVTESPAMRLCCDGLMSDIRAANPDFVYAQFSGRRAVEFIRAYARSGMADSIPVLASPYAVDESLLPLLGADARGIRSVHSWAANLRIDANETFVSAYAAAAGHEPGSFAVLGYEAGQWLVNALNVARLTGRSLPWALAAARLDGPRGQRHVNAGIPAEAVPLFLREVRPSARGFANVALHTLPPVQEAVALAALHKGARSGWLEPHPGLSRMYSMNG